MYAKRPDALTTPSGQPPRGTWRAAYPVHRPVRDRIEETGARRSAVSTGKESWTYRVPVRAAPQPVAHGSRASHRRSLRVREVTSRRAHHAGESATADEAAGTMRVAAHGCLPSAQSLPRHSTPGALSRVVWHLIASIRKYWIRARPADPDTGADCVHTALTWATDPRLQPTARHGKRLALLPRPSRLCQQVAAGGALDAPRRHAARGTRTRGEADPPALQGQLRRPGKALDGIQDLSRRACLPTGPASMVSNRSRIGAASPSPRSRRRRPPRPGPRGARRG
jgi:hypothetical protein